MFETLTFYPLLARAKVNFHAKKQGSESADKQIHT